MHSYRCYGLHVHAALPLPEFVEAGAGRADVVVRYAPLPRPDEVTGRYLVRTEGSDVFYFMPDVGGMLVRDGSEILIDPAPGALERGFRFLVEGIGMGLVLHQRGRFVLHASAVACPAGVLAFIGWKGTGKSTTAAAFKAAGCPTVTDDLLVLDGVQVLPGAPHLKLWPEALAATLGEDPTTLTRIHPAVAKRQRPAEHTPEETPLPLRCIYVLDFCEEGEAVSGTPLSPREATIELTRHAYALRFMGEKGVTPRHFRQATALAQRVPVRRLKRIRSLKKLTDLTRYIEADLAGLVC